MNIREAFPGSVVLINRYPSLCPFLIWGALLLVNVDELGASNATLTDPVPGSNLVSSTVTFTWTSGPGGYLLYVGTTGTGSNDVHNSGYVVNGTNSLTVNEIPTETVLYVRLWCETGPGSGSYFVEDYTFNSDTDSDGILDIIDPNPGVSDPMQVLTGLDYSLTLLGSGRIASLESSAIFNSTFDDMSPTDTHEIAQIVFDFFKDDFDFIIVSSNQSSVPSGAAYAGRFYNARNDIQGIGKGIFDGTSQFGSVGRLQGFIHLTSTSALSGGPSLHEMAHNWGNSLSSIPSAVSAHWGYSNIGGQLGGWQPDSLEDLGGGQYRARSPNSGEIGSWGGFANGGNGLPFSNFELYTMGLMTAEEVGHDIRIANDFSWVDTATGVFQASSITSLTMDDVVATDGPRIPGVLDSQKDFRVLYLILTGTPLTLGEWGQFDEDVYLFDIDGDDETDLYNFWEATGGRATVTMDGLAASLLPIGEPVDPIIGGTPVDGLQDWYLSAWFGYYNTTLAPWLFHAEHGFVYRDPSSTNASMFVYDDAMTTWWWTNETVYPFIYAFDPPADNGGTDIGSEWFFYFEGSKSPRSFGVVTGTRAGEFLFFNP